MKSNYRALFIFFFVFAVLLAIITGTLPFIIESSILQSKIELSKPHSDNVDIWGKFPGKLKTTLKHTFTFFNYPSPKEGKLKDKEDLPISDKSISFTESVVYQNFTFDDKEDKITFKAKRDYTLSNQLKENETVNLPSMGMLELFQTLSRPSQYQQGIASITFLLDQTLGNNENFHKKLFMLRYMDTFLDDPERFKSAILSCLTEEKRNFVYSHEKYGMNTFGLLYNWIVLLNDKEALENAKWLRSELGLTETEIQKILGTDSYLCKFYNYFAGKLIKEFNCDPSGCQLLFKQLSESAILKLFGVNNLQELSKLMSPNAYSFESPEINVYYEKEYKNSSKTFDELKLNEEQLSTLFSTTSKLCLTDPNNLVTLLNLNTTSSTYEAYELYKIASLDQLNFITNYVFNYLPQIYVFPKFTNEDKTYTISGLSKAFSSFAQIFIDKTIGTFLAKSDQLFSLVLSIFAYKELPKDDDPMDVCADILQNVIADGKKVLKICSNEKYNLGTEEGLKNWLKPYLCFDISEIYCNQTFIDEFMKETVLVKTDLEKIYSEDSLGSYLSKSLKTMKEKYGCSGEICQAEEIAKIQYSMSKITLNPPEGMNASYTLTDWDPVAFPTPMEFYYYQKENNFTDEECTEKIKNALTSLYGSLNNIMDEKYSESLTNKYKLEIIFSLLENNITKSSFAEEFGLKESNRFFDLMGIMFSKFLFTNEFITPYKPISVVNGNSDEDKIYLDILRSGPFYGNFKPGLEKTTGFDMNIISSMEDSNETDTEKLNEFTIFTSRSDPSQIMRRIIEMNGQPIYSIKKSEYSPLLNQYVSVSAPLFQSARLDNEDQWISDGYQFPLEDQDTLYYFDELSARKFAFKEGSSRSYDGLKCYEYTLDKDDLVQGLKENNEESKDYAYSTQKFNKPFLASTTNKEFSYNINYEDTEDFMCVDKYSEMVLESSLTLVYAADTKGFNLLSNKIEDNKKMPILIYKREYSVDEDSYNEVFGGVKTFYGWRIAIIVIGVLLIAVLIGLGIYFFLKHKKSGEEGIEQNDIMQDEFLQPADRINRASGASSIY
ncbi:MAG: transmembrane domain-containing protein [archaeon]|nr:transmembrane domain-containing protein [archaeon]